MSEREATDQMQPVLAIAPAMGSGLEEDPDSRTPSLLNAALAYARDGWAVFPCEVRGKRPLTTHGFKDATADPEVIERWWQSWPKANIGLAVPAEYVVVDLDSPEAREAARREGLDLPRTIEAKTGKGWHLWYRLPEGIVVRNTVRVRPRIDLRAFGGYVIAPPSIHGNGTTYAWINREADFALAPRWIFTASGACATVEHPRKLDPGQDWRAAIAGGSVEPGRRNDLAAKLAGHLLRHFVDPQVSLRLLEAWNAAACHPPLPTEELHRTIGSIARAEARRRRGIRA